MASIICQAYKTALDIPRYISTQQLHHLGVRNLCYTDELIEAHRTAHYHLALTTTGRRVLAKLQAYSMAPLTRETRPYHLDLVTAD